MAAVADACGVADTGNELGAREPWVAALTGVGVVGAAAGKEGEDDGGDVPFNPR